jgi:hypothetical protein
MTALISWLGADSRGPSSLYIASDSRLSWDKETKWDRGRKVFHSEKYPHIWGYCGDVLFPSLALGQIVSAIDGGGLFADSEAPDGKNAKVFECLQEHFETYPEKCRLDFSILHCHREEKGMTSVFFAWMISWNRKTGWTSKQIDAPKESGLVISLGSGAKSVDYWNGYMQRSDVSRTSRAVFQAFTLSLKDAKDPGSGGPPQLASLRREGNGQSHGVWWNSIASVNGLTMSQYSEKNGIEFFNENFERVDPKTGLLLKGAQRQPVPRKHPGK